MSLRLTLAGLALALTAGCSSGPDWKEPDMNQKPISLEEQVKETPKKDKPVYDKESKEYSTVELEVSYKFENSIAASSFDGYIKLLEKDKGREFTDYEKMQVAFKVNKEGNIGSKDISNIIILYALEKGTKEVKMPFVDVQEDDLIRKYNQTIAVTSDESGDELLKLIDEKSDAEKAKVAEAVRSVYGGSNPLPIGPKQLQKIKDYK